MRSKIRRKLMNFGRTVVIVMLLVALNINPIAIVSAAILDTGIVDRFSNLGKNLVYLAGQKIDSVMAIDYYDDDPEGIYHGPVEVSIVDTPTSYFGDTEDYLKWIKEYTGTIGNTEDTGSLYNTIRELYEIGSGYSANTKIDADKSVYRDYGKALAVHDEAMTARLLGINERDLSHVNAAQLEQLAQMGYDPRWINENGTIEEDFDKLIRATHEYSVANVYSLNNMIGGALWRPYSDEIPYIREFAEIVGGFANVYMGYWDTNVSTLKKPINSQRALEILGYDAILRYEGIQVLEPTKILENGVEAIFVPEVVGLQKYTESPVQRDIVNDPDVHEEDIPDRGLTISGVGGVPTGQSGVNENIILRQIEEDENGELVYVPEDDIESALVPDSTMIQLYQEEIPNQDITWLDAVTVLYKALGQEQISYQTFTAYNPNITPETSPLSKDLPGLTSFDGYNFYAFFTRSNPYTGDLTTGSFQAIYWRKAINDGFVSYALRDNPISAEDFYMLAQRMMEAYGEPEMSADEMHTLLQIYGSYYPVQLGRTVADAWEYLKCRGILTTDNEPESFTSNITRDQLLDICMRIKDVDSRITYKNMNLVIDVGEVLRDKDYFPVYDFDLKTEEDDEFAFISTTVNYTEYDYYTYMFPVERSVNLGYSGCGLIYSEPEKSDEFLIDKALYEGKKHIEGYDYYVIDVPKDYTGQIFFAFQNYDDPGSVNGTVDFIEVPNYCLGGGIYTAYEINELDGNIIATLIEPEAGVSYFPFSSQSNNMDLVYYCDFDRCGDERPIGESPTVASLWDKVVDTWNYLTQPMEVLASEINTDVTHVDESGNEVSSEDNSYNGELTTKISMSSNYWVTAGETYGSDGNEVVISDVNSSNAHDIRQLSARAPGWASALLRASILCDNNYNVWDINTKSTGIHISDSGKRVMLSQSGVSIGSSVYNYTSSVTGMSNSSTYGLLKENQSQGRGRKAMIAFAAGINLNDIGKISGQDHAADSSSLDKDVDNALRYLNSQNLKWTQSISDFNSIKDHEIGSVYKKAVYTRYTEDNEKCTFTVTSSGYTASNIIAMIGDAGRRGTESGIAGGNEVDIVDVRKSLNTSVIMSKDEQILLCWDDLVAAGFAWGITDGKPKHSEKDGTYTFMTKNGMVKVNDQYHMIQIGATLYTWPDDSVAPNLVYVDDDKNMYLDIRCVTGAIDKRITKMDDKTEIFENRMGAGSYAVYSFSTEGADTSLHKTKSVSCYNFPETPEAVGSEGIAAGFTFPITMNTLDTTRFDGMDVGTNDIYWDESINGMRILVSDFNPTSNWILTITEDKGAYQGKLYVYYLKDAIVSNNFSDNSSLDPPTDEWIEYWEKQCEEQKKRCNINYSSASSQVKYYMEQYSETVPEGYDWIRAMTEAAMYSIAADTGTFHLSSEYAVRCFDVTEAHIPSQPTNTDFRESIDASEEFRTNDSGSVYFMEYAGYVYNLPTRHEFTLADYFAGKFPLPLVNNGGNAIWNINVTWYGQASTGDVIPYGYELTSDGYRNYKDLSILDLSGDLPDRASTKRSSSNGEEINNDTSLPFYIPSKGGGDEVSTFKPAPTAIFARYGILDSTINNVSIGSISQNETKRNYYYIGNRVVCISDDFTSRDANKIPFDFGSSKYNPIAISVTGNDAHFVGQVRRPVSRSYYVIPYVKFYEVDSAITSDSQEEHLATDDSYLWDGKAKLVAVLNMIDRSTNWLMWAVFVLAPMICIIVMTVLIGLSFVTDNKMWQAFCERYFDPIRILTLGMKDSNEWLWPVVWKRAIITYIAFALFANANILKIIIWVVDGWMKITEALGF